MQREKGKVPTTVNKDMVAAGNENNNPKKDWGEFRRRLEERQKENKSAPQHPVNIDRQKSIEMQVKTIIQNKQKEHSKDERDH